MSTKDNSLQTQEEDLLFEATCELLDTHDILDTMEVPRTREVVIGGETRVVRLSVPQRMLILNRCIVELRDAASALADIVNRNEGCGDGDDE